MRPMKVSGLAEIRSARARAVKLQAMERIDKPDLDYIVERLDEVEAKIISMREVGEDGEEVGSG
jgi:tRNA A37 threonylcarbamoyladenosine dehydratase